MELPAAIARVCARRDLDAEEMASVVGVIMDGGATPAQIAAFLIGLRLKGETVDEVVGAARAMRARAANVNLPDDPRPIVDTCGTGGDGAQTVNISTAAALVVAACGVRVAKHGNRSVSSRSGSADVLEALGVDITAPHAVVRRCLTEVGVGFFFAPSFHAATRHVAPVRREIGVRTIFNLLGPLTNPGGARHHVVGVYDPAWLEPIAAALGRLGGARALVVHGAGGLDEFAPHGPTEIAELREGVGHVVRYTLSPRDFALEEGDLLELRGGDASRNADRLRSMLDGERGAARTVVVMTAAAGLYVAGRAGLRDGARLAETVLDDGSALRTLDNLVKASRERRPGEDAVTP